MKNYLSVFELCTKRSLKKLSFVFVVLTVFEIVGFFYILNLDKSLFYDVGTNSSYLFGVEKIINELTPLLSSLGFIAVTLILAFMGCEFSDRQGYTLRRLNISEKKVFLCQSIYSAIIYGIFFMLQAFSLFILCKAYIGFAANSSHTFESFISSQTVFLAFYRSEFLHGFLPLDDILKHLSNLIMIIALSLATSSVSYFMRRKKLFIETFILMPVILINFASDWTELTYDLIIAGVSLFVIGIIIARISSEVQAYDR